MRASRRNAAALMAGFALDRLLDHPTRGHPVNGFGTLAAALEGRTWRPYRSAGIAHVALLLTAAGRS